MENSELITNRVSDKLAAKCFWLQNREMVFDLLKGVALPLIVKELESSENANLLDQMNIDVIAGWLDESVTNEEQWLTKVDENGIPKTLSAVWSFADLVYLAEHKALISTSPKREHPHILIDNNARIDIGHSHYLFEITNTNILQHICSRLSVDVNNFRQESTYKVSHWAIMRNDEYVGIIRIVNNYENKITFENGRGLKDKPLSRELWDLVIPKFVTSETYLPSLRVNTSFPYVIDKDYKAHYIYDLPDVLNVEVFSVLPDAHQILDIRLPKKLPITRTIFLRNVHANIFPMDTPKLNDVEMYNCDIRTMPPRIKLSGFFSVAMTKFGNLIKSIDCSMFYALYDTADEDYDYDSAKDYESFVYPEVLNAKSVTIGTPLPPRDVTITAEDIKYSALRNQKSGIKNNIVTETFKSEYMPIEDWPRGMKIKELTLKRPDKLQIIPDGIMITEKLNLSDYSIKINKETINNNIKYFVDGEPVSAMRYRFKHLLKSVF